MATVDQLYTAIRERKEIAERATAGPWTMRDGWESTLDGLMRCARIANDEHATVIDVSDVDGDIGDLIGRREDFEHIASNSPDRILRDAAEDLATLERHRPRKHDPWLQAEFGDHEWCGACRGNNALPCEEVRSLARRYDINLDGSTE